MAQQDTNYTIKIGANAEELQSVLKEVHGDLKDLTSNFRDFAEQAVTSIQRVVSSVESLAKSVSGIELPSGGVGIDVGARPSLVGAGTVGGVSGDYGGGGGGRFSSDGGISEAGREGGSILRRLAAGTFFGTLFANLVSRIGSSVFRFGESTLMQSVNRAAQYQQSLLYAVGGPGGPAGMGGGIRYGMNATEWTPLVHGMRQPLAPSLRGSNLAGFGGNVENLIMRLALGTGVSPQTITGILAQGQVLGSIQRRPDVAGFGVAPSLQIMGYAGALTTSGANEDGISRFNYSLQETAEVAQSLSSILQTHAQIYDRLNESTLRFAAVGIAGLHGQFGLSTPVAERVMTNAVMGLANPGGGEAGRALAYQSVGYRLGMHPFAIRLALEQGDIETQMQVFRGIRSHSRNDPLQTMQTLLSMGFASSATDARNLYRIYDLIDRGGITEELVAEAQRILERNPLEDRRQFEPMARVEDIATGSIPLLQLIARNENRQIEIGQELNAEVQMLYNIQFAALGAIKELLSWMHRQIAVPGYDEQLTQEYSEAFRVAGVPERISEEIASELAHQMLYRDDVPTDVSRRIERWDITADEIAEGLSRLSVSDPGLPLANEREILDRVTREIVGNRTMHMPEGSWRFFPAPGVRNESRKGDFTDKDGTQKIVNAIKELAFVPKTSFRE